MNELTRNMRSIGQSLWLDNLSRDILESGELKSLLDLGITGITSNPSIFENSLGSDSYDKQINDILDKSDTVKVYEDLVCKDISDASDILLPIFNETNGEDGYVSLEVSPLIGYDTNATIAEAKYLFNRLNKPNVLIKVPATSEGILAIEELIFAGVNINVTLIFSVEQYKNVQNAYINGLKRRIEKGLDVIHIYSVASFFISRIDTTIDMILDTYKNDSSRLLGKIAIANAKVAYDEFNKTFSTPEFMGDKMKGARVQRLLWGSTSAKNPNYSDLLYVDSLIGNFTINTMPQITFEAFIDHGKADNTIQTGLDEAKNSLNQLPDFNINLDQITDKLLIDGVNQFANSFTNLLSSLEAKLGVK